MSTVPQRYGCMDGQTDRRTDDLRQQYHALQYVQHMVKMVIHF